MAKLRKGVRKQKRRSQQKAVPRKGSKEKLKSDSEYKMRDQYLYSSALKSYAISAILLIFAIWMNGDFPPFNEIQNFNGILDQVLNGIVSLALFFFLLLSWGNALEIRGNVLEWKHILFLLVATTFISVWGGIIGMFIALFGSFGILTFLWYANK